MLIAQWIVYIAMVYAAIGLLFAVWVGVTRIDPAARGAGLGFRLLILPGVAALWPVLLARVRRGQQFPPTETNAHRIAAAARWREREGQ